jgi:hypothetical protein
MASILNASLSSGLVATGDTSGIIQLQSNGTQTVNVATNGIITNTFNSAAGIVPGYQYYRLNSTLAGTTATTAQNWLGVGVTLAASTQYEFEIFCLMIRPSGTTSHNITSSFGGTATLNNITYVGPYNTNQTTASPTSLGINNSYFSTSSFTLATGVTTDTLAYIQFKGTVSVNAGGTFIPQYTLSANPGSAYVTQIGSYIKIAPLGASGSNISIGSWA